MKRYEKIVLEAEKGITFEVSEGTSGEVIVRAQNNATANVYSANDVNPPIPEGYKHVCKEENNGLSNVTANAYSTNYVNPPARKGYKRGWKKGNNEFAIEKGSKGSYVDPPIPEGYKHVCGEWNNGFVIERCSDESQFVWIPVGSLDSNGTLDGKKFSEKFGRRNYMNDEFANDQFHEDLNDELREQLTSVEKYGGFYISRYDISKSPEGKLQSVNGAMPLANINFRDAKKIAATIEDNEAVKSHLTFGAEYDSVLEWFIKTKVRTLAEIAEDSTKMGNYYIYKKSLQELADTGSREIWCDNNIYDFAGNVKEWTQERYSETLRVYRGGNYYAVGSELPVAFRSYDTVERPGYFIGFRAALCIK